MLRRHTAATATDGSLKPIFERPSKSWLLLCRVAPAVFSTVALDPIMLSRRMSLVHLAILASVAACGDDAISSADTARADTIGDVAFGDNGVTDTATDTPPADATAADTADTKPVDTVSADTATNDTASNDTASNDTASNDTASNDTNVQDTTPTEDLVADTSSDATSPTDVADTTASACDRSGYTSVASDALGFDNGDLWYLAQSTLGSPVDVFSIEIYAALGGASTPGTYTITDDNYDTCGNCVVIQTDCDETLGNCQRTFLANAGKLTITSIGPIGALFTATLSDLVLTEITYDDKYYSTPVPGGDTWCIDTYDVDVTIQ